MAIALLSLAGFFVAFYMLAHALGWTGPLVCGVGDCATVQSSKLWSARTHRSPVTRTSITPEQMRQLHGR